MIKVLNFLFFKHFLIIVFLDNYLMKRELVFILKDDIHIRYLSFNNSSQFADMLSRKTPYKVDIGAVYNYPV